MPCVGGTEAGRDIHTQGMGVFKEVSSFNAKTQERCQTGKPAAPSADLSVTADQGSRPPCDVNSHTPRRCRHCRLHSCRAPVCRPLRVLSAVYLLEDWLAAVAPGRVSDPWLYR